MYPHGMNQNYNLGKVDSDRNKLLSSHQYNPYITTCAEPLPGEDWLRPPEAYETYRLKGMTNDQSFVMPKFKSASTQEQVKVHENQYNMYQQVNPFEKALDHIPKAIANASKVKEEETKNQDFYDFFRSLEAYRKSFKAFPALIIFVTKLFTSHKR